MFFFPFVRCVFVWAGFVGGNFEVRPKELKHLSIDFDSPIGTSPRQGVGRDESPQREMALDSWDGRLWKGTSKSCLRFASCGWPVAVPFPSQKNHDDFCEHNFLRQSFAVGFSVVQRKISAALEGEGYVARVKLRMTIKKIRLLHAAKRGRGLMKST